MTNIAIPFVLSLLIIGQALLAGDVVKIQPGIEHWHGASPESSFAHIAININTEKGVGELVEASNG